MELNPYQSPSLFGGPEDRVDSKVRDDDRVRNDFVNLMKITRANDDIAWRKIETIQIRAARIVVLVALLLTFVTLAMGVFVETPAWIMFGMIATVFWLSAIVEPMKIRRRNRRLRQRTDRDVREFTVGFSNKGLEWRGDSEIQWVTWDQFIGMREVEGLLLLCCSNDRFWVLEVCQLSPRANQYLRDRIRLL